MQDKDKNFLSPRLPEDEEIFKTDYEICKKKVKHAKKEVKELFKKAKQLTVSEFDLYLEDKKRAANTKE